MDTNLDRPGTHRRQRPASRSLSVALGLTAGDEGAEQNLLAFFEVLADWQRARRGESVTETVD
ncbi:MAG: hypothetical protein KBB14_13515 [Thermoanaerobaculia bacterium]|nr:hypothetical protein [Thermoanaerobaculia bacterium]